MADLSNITALSGLTITSDQTTGTNNPNATFAFPSVTTTQRDKLENVSAYLVNNNPWKVKPGTVIFNITTGFLQIFNLVNNSGVWQNILSVNTTATGAGLTNGTPFVFPSGPSASVEVAANQVNGFTYYDTTSNTLKTRINGTWRTVTTA
jgi:hypothetical protein